MRWMLVVLIDVPNKKLEIHRWCMRASFSFSWQIETYRATIKMLVGWDLCCLLMAWVMAFAVAQRIRCECVSFIHYLTLNSLLDHCLWETTQIIYVSMGWERMKLNLCYFIRSLVDDDDDVVVVVIIFIDVFSHYQVFKRVENYFVC